MRILTLYIITFLFFSCTDNSNVASAVFPVTDYGARGDSLSLDTEAIQTAIDAAATNGGGRVTVPPGVYRCGTLFLKSNVTFEVMNGARILGSPNIEDYTPLTWGHNKDRQPYHLIVIKDADNVTVEGGGTIDGNGPAFWQDFDPDELPMWIMAKDEKISPMFEVENSTNVHIRDVLLTTGGGWTLHLYNSEQVQVRGIKIINNLFSPNGDGIDITGCTDVTISDCIIKTCDDAICLKTTGDSKECKRVAVSNNIIQCSCAALKVGNESFRDISQVTFSNNVVYGSNRIFALYAEGGGTVENITVTNTVGDTRSPFIYNRPIHISLMERKDADGHVYASGIYNSDRYFDVEGRQPRLRNITISNFQAETEGRILITAEPGRMIENLTLRDVYLKYPMIEDPVPNVERAKSRQFSPMNPDAKIARAALVAENVRNLVVDNFNVDWPEEETTPAPWRHPKRIANGTLDAFYPDYDRARQTEFSAVWGRNLQGGYIHAPLASPSSAAKSKMDIKNSSIGTQN